MEPPGEPARQALSAARLDELVDALARAESADAVATVIAERGASAGASFANVAVLDPGTDASARMYHASGLRQEFGGRYADIPVDGSTPLGTVLQTAGEVWLPTLGEAAARYPPGLLADFTLADVGAAAALALTDGQQRVIGALGMAWPAAQAFTDVQKSEVRVIARLAASALRRAQQLEAERGARQRAERLQAMMRALVASASMADVQAAVFQHGLLPFGAAAARLVLTGQDRLGPPLTVTAVGMPEPALTEWRDFPLSAYSPSRKALATSEIVYVPTPADLSREFPAARLGASPRDRAWAAIPLRSGGRTLGVLTLVFSRPHALDEVSDQIALAALGSAVADAIGRAAAHDRDRDLVSSLQRSLLPPALPELPRARLGARYLPAESRYGMGGDWYDAIPLADGRLMLIVGDVAGHGLEAAITMGQVRSAARALAPAYQPARPAGRARPVRLRHHQGAAGHGRGGGHRPGPPDPALLPGRAPAPAAAPAGRHR